jgi:redox-sensitive bicupin YhaK (pirin superfamily)
MTDSVISAFALGPQWAAFDPFLFCAHHDDAYPAGNDVLGPAASLAGRNIGMDFEGKDGWRMYHGDVVPGFPRHPHRGFETVTLVRRGYIDHSDSLGAKARFGHGDCQWMTAGRGIVHCEMFPLLERKQSNPLELFQLWLNLPARDKLVDPYFTMLWADRIPKLEFASSNGAKTHVALVAGQLGEHRPPAPPPNSWAARPESDLAIWTLRMDPGASWRLPAAHANSNRTLYFFVGSSLMLDGAELDRHAGLRLRPEAELLIENGDTEAELLLLQGRPIGEPVAQQGPFVMNTQAELRQAFLDYRKDEFGGWPWPSDDPVHGRERGRFAVHADGRQE